MQSPVTLTPEEDGTLRTDLPLYTWAEIRKHNLESDCWIVIKDFVINATDFLSLHPGGLDPILDMGGYDLTNTFEAIAPHGRNNNAMNSWKKRVIGRLDKTSKPPVVARKVVAERPPDHYGLVMSPKMFAAAAGLVVLLVVGVLLM
jgi:cytochrome b involved in lipid metabolism